MPTRIRPGPWFCAVALIFSAGCNLISEQRADETVSDSERPAGSVFASLGPEDETRIYYQFIDERGRVRFVERLKDVPERWRATAGFVEMSTPPPLTPADARATVARRTQGGREKRAGAPEVILYSADWCGYCKKAQKYLDRRGVPYDLRDVDVASVKKELRSKTGRTGIPVMDVDGRILQGYRASSYDKFLDTAGL